MFWILWILIVIVLILLSVLLYARNQFNLPNHLDNLIDEVIASPNEEIVFDKIQSVDISDTSICYEDIQAQNQDAEVVLLLHGLSQTMLNFPPYFCQSFIDAGFRVVRIDHQGGGGSNWVKNWGNPNKYNLKDMARHAVEVMDHLGVNRFHLLGMSMGGMISQHIALDYPKRVASLSSIMSTAYMDDPSLPNLPRKFIFGLIYVIANYGRNLKSLKAKLRLNLATNRLLYGSDSYQFDDRYTIEAAHYEITKKKGYNPKSRDQHSYAITKAGSRLEALKKINIPSLVIHGTKDPLVLLEHGKKTAEVIPNCKTLYLDGMGHHLPKVFNEEITGAIIDLINTSKHAN